MILQDFRRFQRTPKDSKNSKELISKEYFALREPARAQKANGFSPLLLLWKNQRLRGARVAWAPKKNKSR